VSFTEKIAKEVVMYQQIKDMAQEALKLQNKNFMDETLHKIVAACDGRIVESSPSDAYDCGASISLPVDMELQAVIKHQEEKDLERAKELVKKSATKKGGAK
jgi:hypothetical protein